MARKGRSMPNTRLARVIKHATISHKTKDGEKKFYKYRMAIVYQTWRSPDGKRYGAKTIYRDYFNAILPDKFFEWYKPIRDKYAEIVKQMITDELYKERYKKKIAKIVGEEVDEEKIKGN